MNEYAYLYSISNHCERQLHEFTTVDHFNKLEDLLAAPQTETAKAQQ